VDGPGDDGRGEGVGGGGDALPGEEMAESFDGAQDAAAGGGFGSAHDGADFAEPGV